MFRAAARLASKARPAGSSNQIGKRVGWSRSRNCVAKDIRFGVGARALMLNGIKELADAIKVVTGPKNIHLYSTSTDNNAHKEAGQEETISVTFVDKDGDEKLIKVPIGMSMLEAAHENDIELEGACEGSLACSTCHVIVMDMAFYNKLEEPTDEENDMLDLAFGLTETSRLGCQVIAKPELDGMRLALPAATRNFAVDGYVAKPH